MMTSWIGKVFHIVGKKQVRSFDVFFVWTKFEQTVYMPVIWSDCTTVFHFLQGFEDCIVFREMMDKYNDDIRESPLGAPFINKD